jgi:hypothetical protein
VVGFEAVTAGAPVCGAGPVSEEHIVPGPVRHPVAISRYRFEAVDIDEGGLGFPYTEDLLEGVGSNFESRPGDRSGLAVGAVTLVGVYEDEGLQSPRRHTLTTGDGGVESQRDEGIDAALLQAGPHRVGGVDDLIGSLVYCCND